MLEFLWRLLPDKCQVADCARQGVRGNENNVGGRIVCDYCYSRQESLLLFSRPWWMFWR
jgi:hypothetical protein